MSKRTHLLFPRSWYRALHDEVGTSGGSRAHSLWRLRRLRWLGRADSGLGWWQLCGIDGRNGEPDSALLGAAPPAGCPPIVRAARGHCAFHSAMGAESLRRGSGERHRHVHDRGDAGMGRGEIGEIETGLMIGPRLDPLASIDPLLAPSRSAPLRSRRGWAKPFAAWPESRGCLPKRTDQTGWQR